MKVNYAKLKYKMRIKMDKINKDHVCVENCDDGRPIIKYYKNISIQLLIQMSRPYHLHQIAL